MEPDQPSSTPSIPPSDPLYSLQPASTDTRPFEGSLFDGCLLNPSAPSQGMSTWSGMFQGNLLPIPSSQSSMPRGNGETTNFNIPNIPHTNIYDNPISLIGLGTPSQQFQLGNPSQVLGTLEYPYIEQPQTIHPAPANSASLHDWQQSVSLPQISLGPDPHSQARAEPGLLGVSFCENTLFGPPPGAATTSQSREPVDEPEPQVTNLPPSTIKLESPRPPDGENTVRVRRDACVTLSFCMQSLSSGSATYDGLKIPRTPSVRGQGREEGKKLLRLQIRVLGATTKAPYETLCRECQDREGDRGAFPDFRARSNILVPQKNGRVFVAFSLACYSKHRQPNDSEYCLEVVLHGGPEQNILFTEHALPFLFVIVARLPPRTRDQAEDVDDVDDVDLPPPKLPRTGSGRAGRVRNSASQDVSVARGDPGGPTNNTSSGTSRNPVPPVGNHHLASSAEALLSSRQCHQTANSVDDETADGQDIVVDMVNPKQGPTTGGLEIWVSGWNFPSDLGPLYVRFGDKPACVAVHRPGLLSCILPPADVPGIVKVALSRSFDPKAPTLGTSICQFEYVTDLNDIMPIIIRIQKGCTPEVADALDNLHKEMKKQTLTRPLRGGEACHGEVETAIIQALAPLQNTQNFGEVISKTNDYNQTLAHFAVLVGYTNLLSRLVGWNIDLTIADVNGSTALYYAYKKGDKACVNLLLEKGASETVMDALGRVPSHLMPGSFASWSDDDTDMASDGQLEVEQKRVQPSLSQSTDSWDGVSDSGDEESMNEDVLADSMHQSQFSSAASNGQSTLPSPPLHIAPAYPPLSPTSLSRYHTIAGTPPPNRRPPSPPSPFCAHSSSPSSLQHGQGPPEPSVQRSHPMYTPPGSILAVPTDNPGALPIPMIPYIPNLPPSVEYHHSERTAMNQYASPPSLRSPLPPEFQSVLPPPARCSSPPSTPLSSRTPLAPTIPLNLPDLVDNLSTNSENTSQIAVPSPDIQQPSVGYFEQDFKNNYVMQQSSEFFVCGELNGDAQANCVPETQNREHAAAPQQLDVRTNHEPMNHDQTAAVPVPTMDLAHDLQRRDSKYWRVTQIIAPITLLPPELLYQILLIIIDDASDSPSVLMRVSKLWYTIVTGIWASLKLGTKTPKNAVTRKLERNPWLVDVLVDTAIDRGPFTPSDDAYQAIFAAIEGASRWRTLIVESLPAQADLPEHLVNRGLQRCSDPVMSRLKTFKIKCPCEMSPLLDRLLRILGTSASGELTTVEINSANVISLLVPMYPSIFNSIKVLSIDTPGLPGPVDILPHLHQLETLTASHISLLIYHGDVNIPLAYTLRHLTLRAVSIQWMSGRTFHVLESCIIIFPLHHHILHTFSTTLPNCNTLTFKGHPLDILRGVSAHTLTHLSVISPCSYKPKGSQQLVLFSSRALREHRLAPRVLHISIEATSEAWIKAFDYMSNLEELVIENAQPSSLGVRVLRSLVVHPNLGTIATHGGSEIPVCPSLERFGLRYRRWLRPGERFDFIPELVTIISSRQQSKFSLQSFRIWKGSEEKDALELIEGSWISLKGFQHLANDSAIEGQGLLRLVPSGLVGKPVQGLSFAAYPQIVKAKAKSGWGSESDSGVDV